MSSRLYPIPLFRTLFIVLMIIVCPVKAAIPASVQIPSLDGTMLNAWLFLPENPNPSLAIVAMHGCNGLYAKSGSRKGQLSAFYQSYADLFVKEGYAVVFPDSLSTRGEQDICTQKIGNRRVTQVERRVDALGAGNWIKQQAWAKNLPLAIIGWSHGGSTVLGATNTNIAQVKAMPWQFAMAIAFYPGCGKSSFAQPYIGQTRLILMLGAKDDWTAPEPCIELGQRVNAEINVFPESYHAFDAPSGTVRFRADVPNGAHPGQGVHVGANPVAREKALKRLQELLFEIKNK